MTTPAISPGPHIELSAVVRLEADYLPIRPRAALLRLADELESRSDRVVISRDALCEAILAATTDEHPPDSEQANGDSAQSGGGEPVHNSMPARLRRRAYRGPAGPDREALLRYADELEEKGDPALVSPVTLRAALRAHSASDPEDDF